MATCQHCSAPLPSNSIICEYCGVRNDIELRPKHSYGLPKSHRTCPDCLVQLESLDIGKNSRFIIEKCGRCFGLFFDHHELERLLEERLENSYWINHQKLHDLLQHPLHKDKVIYRRCPECNRLMQRQNYLRRSGVIMDVCNEHGLWLDAGELKQIQEWIALGGKHNTLKDELDEKHRHSRAQEQKRRRKNRAQHYEGYETSSSIEDALGMITGLFKF